MVRMINRGQSIQAEQAEAQDDQWLAKRRYMGFVDIGLVAAHTLYDRKTGKPTQYPAQITIVKVEEETPYHAGNPEKLLADINKASKQYGAEIAPYTILDKYGKEGASLQLIKGRWPNSPPCLCYYVQGAGRKASVKREPLHPVATQARPTK